MVQRKLMVHAAMVMAALAGCGDPVSVASAQASKPARESKAQPVSVAQVNRGPLSRPIEVSGLVRPKQAHTLAFKVGGALHSVSVEPGMKVRKGQTLAMVDPSEYAASAAQARDGLEKAERDLARARALVKEGAIARATLDDAETAASVARSSTAAANFNERHTVLVAPTEGTVEARLAEPGEIVAPGRPILSFIGDKRGWVVDVALSDRDVLALRAGVAARVRFDGGPEVEAALGDISRISNPRTGTFNAEVVLPTTMPLTPRSGLVARVSIARVEEVGAVVPLSALVDGSGKRAFVYALDGDVVRRREVDVAFFADEEVGLTTELAGVERVVTRGAHDLTDGAHVSVADGSR